MIEMRWILTDDVLEGGFCQQLVVDGKNAFIRLQYRELVGMQVEPPAWVEIPVVTALKEKTRIKLVGH
jgi:hypothetical protein